MGDVEFLKKVRGLEVHERAVRAPSRLRSESTMVFASLEELEPFLAGVPADVEVEVARKKDRYVVYIRR